MYCVSDKEAMLSDDFGSECCTERAVQSGMLWTGCCFLSCHGVHTDPELGKFSVSLLNDGPASLLFNRAHRMLGICHYWFLYIFVYFVVLRISHGTENWMPYRNKNVFNASEYESKYKSLNNAFPKGSEYLAHTPTHT